MKINNLSKDPLGRNLVVSYKYYLSLIENMTLEEKKISNLNNVKIRDIQINKLINQIQIRDQLIHQAREELRKRNEKLEMNEEIKNIEEVKNESYRILPLINSHQKFPQKSAGLANSNSRLRSGNLSFDDPSATGAEKRPYSKNNRSGSSPRSNGKQYF